MKSVEARLCVTQSQIHVLIAETPPFDGHRVNAGWTPLLKPKGPTGVFSGEATLEEVEVFNKVNAMCRRRGIQKDRRPSHPSVK